jgi:carbon storage regulator CsrA
MLVLTRVVGEEIHIGINIVISTCRIRGQRTQLGIQAPPEIDIRRKAVLFEDPRKLFRRS